MEEAVGIPASGRIFTDNCGDLSTVIRVVNQHLKLLVNNYSSNVSVLLKLAGELLRVDATYYFCTGDDKPTKAHRWYADRVIMLSADAESALEHTMQNHSFHIQILCIQSLKMLAVIALGTGFIGAISPLAWSVHYINKMVLLLILQNRCWNWYRTY